MSLPGPDAASGSFPMRDARQQIPLAARAAPTAGLGLARWLVVFGGLLAGLVAFGVGEKIRWVIPPKLILQSVPMLREKQMLPTRETVRVAVVQNAGLTFGVLGICLGGFLGLAGGLAHRPDSATARGGGLGAVLGLALGAGLPFALFPMSFRASDVYPDHDLLISLAMHGLVWAPLGAAAGLAFAVGLGRWRLGQALAAGLIGAFLGTAAFELIGAAFFTLANTQEPISDTPSTRLMARLLVTLGTAGFVALVLPGRHDAVAADMSETETPSPKAMTRRK